MPAKKLAIFDIDGTLVKSNAADSQYFIQTIQAVIHPEIAHYEEERFTHFTDSCIAQELFLWHQGARPSAEAVERFRQHYFGLLSKADPAGFSAVAGARSVLRSLPDEWQVALATGCWRESAGFKLAFAQIEVEGLPMATASEGFTRQEILNLAHERARQAAGVADFERVVYIGDGIWDVRTCASLGIPFVGIEAEANPHKQMRLGRHWLLTDYSDLRRVVEALETAEIPAQGL